MGLCQRGLIRLRWGILALLSRAARKYSFSRVRPGVSSTAFVLSLVSIGLSIDAFTLNCLVVLTLGVGVVWPPLELASGQPPLELVLPLLQT